MSLQDQSVRAREAARDEASPAPGDGAPPPAARPPAHDGAAMEVAVRALLDHVAGLRKAHGEAELRRAIDRIEQSAGELLGVLEDERRDAIPPPAASSSRVVAGGRRTSLARPLEGVRVLVVDDENDARDLAAMVLAQAGAEVTEASSAAEALRILQRHRPDVVVSDIGMPGQDGHTLIRTIRDLPSPLGAVRAMAVTAFARTEDRHRSLDAGFDLHVVKPVDPTNLVGSVARLVGRDPTVAA